MLIAHNPRLLLVHTSRRRAAAASALDYVSTYFNVETQRLVAERYACDIERIGYRFEA